MSSIKWTGEAAQRAAVEAAHGQGHSGGGVAAHGRGKKRTAVGTALRRATTTAAYWQGEAVAEVEAANR